MKFIDWVRLDPTGNITCLVLTKVPRELYLEIARKLLPIPEQGFEQVGFIIDDTTMEMAGLEFCGNGSRGFGLWSAKKQGLVGEHKVLVNVSGLDKPLEVFVNTEKNFTRVSMPLPEKIETIGKGVIPGCPEILKVDLGGIMHFVLLDIIYSDSIFVAVQSYAMKLFNPPALGVMFVDSRKHTMVPIVYVKEVDTIFMEGSCGSGTVAAIIALADKSDADGDVFHCDLVQPKGSISSTLYREDGRVREITIEGPVEIGEIQRSVLDEL